MKLKLLPLSAIPRRARDGERRARSTYRTPLLALDAAPYEIVDAEGCYSGQPHTYGWVCSADAAQAVAQQITKMPGNTHHCARAARRIV